MTKSCLQETLNFLTISESNTNTKLIPKQIATDRNGQKRTETDRNGQNLTKKTYRNGQKPKETTETERNKQGGNGRILFI